VHDGIDQLARLFWDLAAGKHDYGSVRAETPHLIRDLVAIHFGHVVIEKHRVKTE
jgi:hypothetical protein